MNNQWLNGRMVKGAKLPTKRKVLSQDWIRIMFIQSIKRREFIAKTEKKHTYFFQYSLNMAIIGLEEEIQTCHEWFKFYFRKNDQEGRSINRK